MLPKFAEKDRECYQWKPRDVRSYRLICDSYEPFEFFGKEPITGLEKFSSHFLNCENLNIVAADMSTQDRCLIKLLQLTLGKNNCGAYPGCYLTKELLDVLGYKEGKIITRTNYSVPYEMSCQGPFYAKIDVCLMQGPVVLLPIIQDDEPFANPWYAEPRVISAAIALFQNINMVRESIRLERLSVMTIPCILMRKTIPTFYLVPVSEELNKNVLCGFTPQESTHFSKCSIADGIDIGMENPKYRKLFLQHLDAFKDFAKDHWMKFGLFRNTQDRRTKSSEPIS